MTDPTDDPSGAEPSTGAAPDPEAPSADAAAAAATAGPPRTLELEVEVVGTPEAVWQAIATGPGISSWYVPHTVEERPGGAATASFGDAPEMQIPGRVAAWDPPRRIMFDGGEGVGGLAFEWLVEARDQGTCIVRLINSGFGDGDEWDDQYDAMREGWGLFLYNLQLHCEHFAGRTATSMQPMGMWPLDRDAAWARLTTELGLPATPALGERVSADAGEGLELAGTTVAVGSNHVALLLDTPAPGTAFLAAEGSHGGCGVSVWAYL
ncbi:MAG: SRPBCC domain-containing protein, partial [Acidimicrobiales bacterium]|nr:SRPBCC domain-containing protein [Acidimicrobiales bacterium]